MTLILSLVGGCLIGLVSGLMGASASILVIPLFIAFFHATLYQAIVASMITAFAIGLVSTLNNIKDRQVCWKHAGYFGLAASCIAFFTAKSDPYFSISFQWGTLALMSFLAAFFTFRQNSELAKQDRGDDLGHIEPQIAGLVGMGIGTVTGLSGVGCGFLLEPLLHSYGGLNWRKSQGTSQVVIVLSLISTLMGFDSIHFLSNQLLMPFAGTAAATAFLISRSTSPYPVSKIRPLYAALLSVLGLWFIYGTFAFMAPK